MRRRLNSRPYEPLDEWLESLGLYRKQVARDGSCLFRAVAELVYMTQMRHMSVRALCLEYMLLHKEDFQPFLEIPVDHHVFNLRNTHEWGGHPEMIAMSQCFKVDFLIYQDIGQPPFKATENKFSRILMLCFMQGNHYDIIYKKEDAIIRGFCQSLLYDILYSHVFKLKDVQLAVDAMLHDKEYASLRKDSGNSTEMKEIGALVEKVMGPNTSQENSQDEADKNTSVEERQSVEGIHPDDVRGLLAHGKSPFPYKVAKSLDANIYRNIEFDAWSTARREARYGPFDSNGFQAGVKVFVKLNLLPNRKEIENMRKAHIARQGNAENEAKPQDKTDVYHGHIQEMSENKGPVDVFIEEIGIRMKVPYESLEKVPPSPPRSPWHPQGRGGPGGGAGATGGAVVAGVPSYKKLSGCYQKAPLPPENDYSTGRSKKKGKQLGEVVNSFPVPSIRYSVQTSSSGGYRGKSGSSPSPHSHSPSSRTQHNTYTKSYPNRGYRNTQSPAKEGLATYSSTGSTDAGMECVWQGRANTNHSGPSHSVHNQAITTQMPYCTSHPIPPPHPQPPMVCDGTLGALQQVMSAGGQQEVRVTGQKLEVINVEKQVDIQNSTGVEESSLKFENTSTPKTEERVGGSEAYENHDEAQEANDQQDSLVSEMNGLQVEPLVPSAANSNTANGEVVKAPALEIQENVTYMSPPPIPPPQMGCVPPPHGPMYTVTCPPPYPSPGVIQMFSPVPPNDGTSTPSEFSTPPITSNAMSVLPHTDGWDPNTQGTESDAMKMNQGMSSYMVYHVPVMYGGYGYNQPWGYPVPVMPSPNMEDSKQSPAPGSEGYPQMVAVSGWGPGGYMGDMPVVPQPQSIPGPPPPQPLPPPAPSFPPPPPPHASLAFPPPPPPPPHYQPQEGREGSRERSFYPHPHRGRGRGGPHHLVHHHHRGNHHHNSFQGGMSSPGGRGSGPPRSMPPRFQRGGGGPGGRGARFHHHQNAGPSHYHPNHSNMAPQYHHHHHHHHHPNHRVPAQQYEGQPLMQMGSTKSSSESLVSQVASGGSVASGGLASPPIMTYVEPERLPNHGMLPLPPPEGPPNMPPQDSHIARSPQYYATPPGYVVPGPWMWKIM